jgi:hypothetical protein
LKRKLVIIGITLGYAAFIISIAWMILTIVSGCAESDAVRYARLKYPECDVTEVESTRWDTTVEVRCKYREPFRRTFRNRR